MELTSATSSHSLHIAELQAVINPAAGWQQQLTWPAPPPPVLKNESHYQLPRATDAEVRQVIQQAAEAECAVTLTREQRKAAYAKRWAPEPHAREVDLVLGEVDYDDVTDLEALWEKGTGWMLGRWRYSEAERKKLRKQREEDARIRSGWMLGRWRYSEAEREKLRKQREEDARIRSELRRLNEDASYEPVSCVPLSNSAISFLDDQEAAGVVVSDAAPAAAACDVPSPAPKPLPPSARPAPLEASSPPPAPSDPRASEAPLSVDGARRA
jgi:hypothetical protein